MRQRRVSISKCSDIKGEAILGAIKKMTSKDFHRKLQLNFFTMKHEVQ